MHPLRLESASAVTLLRFMSMMSPTRHIKRCWRSREQLCSVTKWLAATERFVNFVRLFQGHEDPFATRVLHVMPTFFGARRRGRDKRELRRNADPAYRAEDRMRTGTPSILWRSSSLNYCIPCPEHKRRFCIDPSVHP